MGTERTEVPERLSRAPRGEKQGFDHARSKLWDSGSDRAEVQVKVAVPEGHAEQALTACSGSEDGSAAEAVSAVMFDTVFDVDVGDVGAPSLTWR